MELLEREAEQALLREALDDAACEGRVVLVVGESGIGKTRLVHSVIEQSATPALWSACVPLSTPRPLGPVLDAVGAGDREAQLEALLTFVDDPPGVFVVEDAHWIDDATLDLLTLFARRLARRRGALVVTGWPEMLGPVAGVRRMLSGLPRDVRRTIEPAPLSIDAVRRLAGPGIDAVALHRSAAGNPFYVLEALAAPAGAPVPATVQSAVAARHAALSADARAVLDVVAVVAGPCELALLRALADDAADGVDECVTAGVLELRGIDAVAFRHQLAGQATAQSLGILRRRTLESRVLAAMEVADGIDPARLVHHARGAADAAAVRRHAPVAARAAARLASHRQALEHWDAARASGLGREALEGIAHEAYLCGHAERALEARAALLAEDEARGDRRVLARSLCAASRALWWASRREEAVAAAVRAVAVLDPRVDGPELAKALSVRAQLAMLAEDHAAAVADGGRAIELAARHDDEETVVHATINVGTAMIGGPDHERARDMLADAFARAGALGVEDHAARALVNLATTELDRCRDDPRLVADIDAALAFTRPRELDGYSQYLLGARAELRLARGDWDGAATDLGEALAFDDRHGGVSLGRALVARGRLEMRRGDRAAHRTLALARAHAEQLGELQRTAPVAAARAELAWLQRDARGVREAAAGSFAQALDCGHMWFAGELALWLHRAGALGEAPAGLPAPYARAVAGDAAGAARAWEAIGFAFEAAVALSDVAGREHEAIATLDGIGATAVARRLRRDLRARGVRRIPRGPRTATRADPHGLTPRQLEVLALLARGATNADIADRLVVSPKTIDHHVSAVLSKLGARNRREAVAMHAGTGLEHLASGRDRDPT